MTLTAYLDTNIASAIVRGDLPQTSDLGSLKTIFAHNQICDVRLVTSAAMKTELEKIPGEYRDQHLAIYESLGRVPYVPPATPGQPSPVWGGHLGFVHSGIRDAPEFSEIRHVLGIGKKHWPDAEHLFEAIKAGAMYFITVDYRSILKHRQTLESGFPIKLRDPTEFVSEMGWSI